MNITQKFDEWPERAQISVRLHLYDAGTKRERCALNKLTKVFALAREFGVQENISTNLNRYNAVYVELNNYILQNRNHEAAVPGSWGNHFGFLLALIKQFPNEVFVDPPEGYGEDRYALGEGGLVTSVIETWDSV